MRVSVLVITSAAGLGCVDVRVGFFFDTRDRVANQFEGWYVDDVTVTALP